MVAVKRPEPRTYNRRDCITFRKTAERFGGLSNMAGGYPLFVNGVRILTSEALYQACRFPHLPDVQRLIIAERSPMTAKMKSKPYRDNSRPDWDIVRTKIMRWSLQVKLIQNWEKFSNLLLETGDLPIVEDSRKDDFWGAKPVDEEILTGINVLGRLLMQLREQVKSGEITSKTIVRPLSIPDFLLYGRQINPVSADGECHIDTKAEVSFDKEVASQLTPEVVLLSEDRHEPVDDEKNALSSYSENSLVEREINPVSADGECHIDSNAEVSVDKKVASQLTPEVVLLSKNTHEPVNDEKNALSSNSENSLVEIESDGNKYDLFYIVLPHIEDLLHTERTDKELAELFKIPLTVMRGWLDRAVKLGRVKKLRKPVKYVLERQLSLLN